MPQVIRLSDYTPLDHQQPPKAPGKLLCFPADRVVRWPEQRLPMVIVVPSFMPPFFQVVERRL